MLECNSFVFNTLLDSSLQSFEEKWIWGYDFHKFTKFFPLPLGSFLWNTQSIQIDPSIKKNYILLLKLSCAKQTFAIRTIFLNLNILVNIWGGI